jgi:hypothetical protein
VPGLGDQLEACVRDGVGVGLTDSLGRLPEEDLVTLHRLLIAAGAAGPGPED